MKEKKQRLYALCNNYVQERVNNAQQQIQSIQQAANDDTKNTAGDKHETGRAMMHLEREKADLQLIEAQKLANMLERVNITNKPSTIQTGSLATTTQGLFFICIGAGKLKLESETVWAVAPTSPVAQAMIGKKPEESYSLNGREFKILEIG